MFQSTFVSAPHREGLSANPRTSPTNRLELSPPPTRRGTRLAPPARRAGLKCTRTSVASPPDRRACHHSPRRRRGARARRNTLEDSMVGLGIHLPAACPISLRGSMAERMIRPPGIFRTVTWLRAHGARAHNGQSRRSRGPLDERQPVKRCRSVDPQTRLAIIACCPDNAATAHRSGLARIGNRPSRGL